MPTETPKPDIKILAYVTVNDIQQFTDGGKQISRYMRSFRYEHREDPLVCRRMAFSKLLDERQSRMFGYDVNPEQQLRGLLLYLEYLTPYEKDKEGKTRELKKLHLLTGEPMETIDQLTRWQKELGLLQAAFPEVSFPIMPVESGDSVYEILETPYWTSMYFFYDG